MIGSKLFYFTIFAVVCVSLSVFVGGSRELQGNDLREAINNLYAVLAKLATGDGPSYSAVKVTKVTVAMGSGPIHTYTVELDKSGASKQCTVEIWSQPWLDRSSTTIECEGDDKATTWQTSSVI